MGIARSGNGVGEPTLLPLAATSVPEAATATCGGIGGKYANYLCLTGANGWRAGRGKPPKMGGRGQKFWLSDRTIPAKCIHIPGRRNQSTESELHLRPQSAV